MLKGVLLGLAVALATSTIAADEPFHANFSGVLPANSDARALNVIADSTMQQDSAVAGYFTTNKFSSGAGFGVLAEVEDVTGKGPIWGAEIDVLSVGKAGVDPWLRRGLGVVVGVNQGRNVPTIIGTGIDVLPFWRDKEYVSVNYGLNIGVHANVAAIAVMPGERVCLESSGQICLRYNPASLQVEIVNGERVLQAWSIN